MTALFLAHGAPTLALQSNEYTAAVSALGARLPRPRAVLVCSAHWQTHHEVRICASARPKTIHDFSGFPPALYDIQYPAPGSPELAGEVAGLLAAAHVQAEVDPQRGLDHGAWVPLRLLWPEANVPIVQLSVPQRDPEQLVALGRALSPLRDQGVLILGSGGVVHNLGRLRFGAGDVPPEPWAVEFDQWVSTRVLKNDVQGLARYRSEAPHARLAVPSSEHLDPLFVVLGSLRNGESLRQLYSGFEFGSISYLSFTTADA